MHGGYGKIVLYKKGYGFYLLSKEGTSIVAELEKYTPTTPFDVKPTQGCDGLVGRDFYNCRFAQRYSQMRRGQYFTSDDVKVWFYGAVAIYVAAKGYQKFNKWNDERIERNSKKSTLIENRQKVLQGLKDALPIITPIASAATAQYAQLTQPLPSEARACIEQMRSSVKKILPQLKNLAAEASLDVKDAKSVIAEIKKLPVDDVDGREFRNAFLASIAKYAMDAKITEDDLDPVRRKVENWAEKFNYSSIKAAKLFDDTNEIINNLPWLLKQRADIANSVRPNFITFERCMKPILKSTQ